MASEWDEEALRDRLAGEPWDSLADSLEDALTRFYRRVSDRDESDDGRQNQDDQALIETIVLVERHNATMT